MNGRQLCSTHGMRNPPLSLEPPSGVEPFSPSVAFLSSDDCFLRNDNLSSIPRVIRPTICLVLWKLDANDVFDTDRGSPLGTGSASVDGSLGFLRSPSLESGSSSREARRL